MTILKPAFNLFKKDGQVFSEQGLHTDTSFFDIFSFPVIEGDPKAALKDKNAIILTATMARQFFGSNSPIGKEMEGRDKKMMTVKAVIEDVPDNHHFKFNYLTSLDNNSWYINDKKEWNWSASNYWSYVLLKEGADIQKVETAMKPFGEKAAAELVAFNYSIKPRWFLQALTDIHLHSRMNYELETNSDIRYLNLSASIAFIILCLALINYMNLATARSSQRAKEVGMRKVLGAKRRQLVSQFMAESFLLTLFSFGLAIGLARLLLPEAAENTIAYIQNTLKTVMPQLPFEHHYLDDSFDKLYKAEKRFGAAFNIFTLIALFIACIGMFGLVTHYHLCQTNSCGLRYAF